MGVTRHGCNQSALLGNAVVVSLCLWMGLSTLYRILAFIIAPTIEMKHCLSITGYSFFAWNLALLMSYPLETYQDIIGLPVFIPLALFGLPSAVAQGCVFWEYTPASSLTLQPTAFPSSLQQCASQHIRCLQRIAWVIPKVVAFVLVTATHYQFLWYLARVYMPGKKEACQLSALVQPSQYADIITQKVALYFSILHFYLYFSLFHLPSFIFNLLYLIVFTLISFIFYLSLFLFHSIFYSFFFYAFICSISLY